MADDLQQDTAGAVAGYLASTPEPARAAHASMMMAVDSNPDFEAELRRVAARTGVPIDSARAYPEDVKKRAAINQYDYGDLAARYPSTTKYLANPDNARIAHDDVENLSQAEATIGAIVGPKPTFGSVATGLLKSLPQGAEMARQGLRLQFADLLGFENMRADAQRRYSQASLESAVGTPSFDTSTGQAVYGGVTSALRALPGLAASIATRSTAPLLATAGVQTQAEAYGKYRNRGASAGAALAGATGEGAVEVATELLPMSFLVQNLGKVGAGRFLSGLLAREVPGEQVATLVQDAIDTAVANPDKTWGQYLAERPEAAYQTLVATITQAAIMEGANTATRIVHNRSQQAQQAAEMGQALEQLNAISEASKVRSRDTTSAQEFLQSLMQDGRDSVWITPQALSESGMLEQIAQTLPSVAAQLEQAANTNTDIRIPIADLMANMAGQELAQSIIPHVSDEPGGFTQTTAAEYLESGAAQQLAEEVQRTLAAKQDDDAFTASRQAVETNFREQLDTAGRFSPEVNQAYASMLGSFYSVQAARLGVTPEEMAQRYPLQVKADALPGAKMLDQQDLTVEVKGVRRPVENNLGRPIAGDMNKQLAFYNWFGDSKAVDDQGRPVVVYHGTASDFSQFDASLLGGNTSHPTAALGFFFSADPKMAASFVGEENDDGTEYMGAPNANVIPAYVSLQNPLEMGAQEFLGLIKEGNEAGGNALIERMKAIREGGQYDGVIIKGDPVYFMEWHELSKDTYVAFKPEQIKSATGNDGTFDANDPNLLSQGTGPRGSLSFADDITTAPSVITLLRGADLSTFLHESGHFFLEVMNDIASRDDAPQDLKDDMTKTLAWFGVPDLATWNNYDLEQKREHHEKFARGFEAYLMEGKAPTRELQGMFSRFRSWLVNVYRSLTQLNVELTADVRGVFDRMLASADAIAQAEREAGFAGMFGTKPEFMTDEQWTAYRALSMEASEGAVRDLETRSIKDMQWLSGARSRALAKLQRDAASKRKTIREEVTAEVMSMPTNQARTFFRRGLNPDGSPAEVHKLSIDSLVELYGGEGDKFAMLNWEPLGYGKYGALAKDGITPDMAAELFGFDSGDVMVRELLDAEPAKDTIKRLTDQRMLERYGDLVDEQAIQRAVDEAVHSEAHTRFVASELRALNEAAGKPSVLAKAAQTYAEQIVARTAVRELRPHLFTAAARRAGRASEEAFRKGDIQTAAAEKQTQLINTYAAKAAMDARADVEKILDRFGAMTRGTNEKVAKTRDLDMVMATRAILAEFDIGTRGAKATEYLSKVESYDPAMAAVLRERIDAATENAQPYRDLSIEQLRGLRDEVESLWYLARRSRQMEVDGDLLDREDVQAELRARLEEIGIPETVPGEGRAITEGEVQLTRLQSLRAALRRVEAWADAKDGANTKMGPFRKFIWNSIKDPADAYRADKAKYLKQYRALLDTIAPTLKPVKIAAPELNYTFGFDKGSMGKVELLHAILHTGNAGNKKKLLLGRKWGALNEAGELDTTQWDAFVRRMIDQGVLTKADFDFAQGVWDLLEEMKPAAQKAHREAFGRYFDEVTSNAFDTPFGQYRGGYVPAMADSRIVADAKTRAIMEEENSTLMNALPSTSKGFTKARVEYNRPLLLDLRALSQHIDKVLLFTHLTVPVQDVRRILASNTVSTPLHRVDPSAYDGLLTPWLNRAARQQVETQVSGSNGLMRFFSVVRARAGMAAMFANVSNTAQQITGFSIASLKVKPSYLAGAAVNFIREPMRMAEIVAEASPYMANRMSNEVAAMNDAIGDILLNPSVYQRAVAWTQRHTYFLQSAVDNVMGPIIWHGAYNQAMETAPAGMTQEELQLYARRLADSAVRETQGSTLPEDISRIETGNAFVRMFTQFAGYFNMQANILGTEFAKVAQDVGLRKGVGRGFYILLFGFFVPAWVAQAIALAFRGGPEDDDRDGSYLDDWIAQTFGWGTLRAGTAMVPVVGQTVNALANTFNKKPYDDRISTSPAISMIESAASVPSDVYKLATGTGSVTKTVRDVATLMSLTVGLPVNGLARPLIYAVDVQSGRADPTSTGDAVRGAITGVSSPESKNR